MAQLARCPSKAELRPAEPQHVAARGRTGSSHCVVPTHAAAAHRAATPGRSPIPPSPGIVQREVLVAQVVHPPRRSHHSPSPSDSKNARGSFVKGDLVDYCSSSYQSWVAAQVTNVDPETGAIHLDVKPQPISLQEQQLLLRPRLKPGQAQLEWMHAVMQGGRIHDEARDLFFQHAGPQNCFQADEPPVLRRDKLPAIAAEVDALLGVCGAIKGLIQEIRRVEQEVLTLDAFTSAFWEQISSVYHTYGSALSRQHDEFHRREDPGNVYDFESVQTLGGGTYGQVKLVRERKTQAKRAVKIISKVTMGGCLDIVDSEIDNLCRMDHPHIAKLYEYFEDTQNFYLIMDYCSGGDLQQKVYAAKRSKQPLSQGFVADVMRQVLLATVHIHAHGIVHLDIKSANIMLMPSMGTLAPVKQASIEVTDQACERPHVMVIDLGVSQFFRPGNFRFNQPMGTPATMAPEVWSGEITPKADVFSCGVVLYELLSLRLPLLAVPCNQQDAIRFWNLMPVVDWSVLRHVPAEGIELCRHMMTFSRHHRPAASKSLFSAFLRPSGQPQDGPSPLGVPAEIVNNVARLPERSVLYLSIALAIARRWPANQWPTVKRWFNELNVAGSGRLDKQHISESLRRFGIAKVQACNVAEAMDLSRDGTVGWTDFIAACINLGSDEFEDTLLEKFQEADSDNDGLLTQHDLSKLLPSGYAAERAQDVFHDLTGRRELGARVDWPTFRQHFRSRSEVQGVGRAPGAAEQASGLACAGLAIPELFGIVREAADKARSRWFPVPGPPEREEEQLQRLADMGFSDRERCLEVLRRHRNDLSGSAIEELCHAGAH